MERDIFIMPNKRKNIKKLANQMFEWENSINVYLVSQYVHTYDQIFSKKV